jgi:hypothetical protein
MAVTVEENWGDTPAEIIGMLKNPSVKLPEVITRMTFMDLGPLFDSEKNTLYYVDLMQNFYVGEKRESDREFYEKQCELLQFVFAHFRLDLSKVPMVARIFADTAHSAIPAYLLGRRKELVMMDAAFARIAIVEYAMKKPNVMMTGFAGTLPSVNGELLTLEQIEERYMG